VAWWWYATPQHDDCRLEPRAANINRRFDVFTITEKALTIGILTVGSMPVYHSVLIVSK